MPDFRRMAIGLVIVVVSITALRLVLPYDLDQGSEVSPEVAMLETADHPDYLPVILENNIWDRDRTPLEIAGAHSAASGEETVGEPVSAPVEIMLLGVSTGEGEHFAIIATTEQVERYVEGDQLPDGSRLEEILEHGIRISRLERNEYLYLFGKN